MVRHLHNAIRQCNTMSEDPREDWIRF